MRFALILALATLPLASVANAGGIPGITLPHLTWPQSTSPETTTRDCPAPTVISGAEIDTCPQES